MNTGTNDLGYLNWEYFHSEDYETLGTMQDFIWKTGKNSVAFTGLCRLAHNDTKRKNSDIPYWIHPICVAYGALTIIEHFEKIVQCPYDKELVVSDALCHDIVEDEDSIFASHILSINPQVLFDTYFISKPQGEWYEKLNRATRKRIYFSKLRVAPYHVKLIKLCDVLHNLGTWDPKDGFAYGPGAKLHEEVELLLEAIFSDIDNQFPLPFTYLSGKISARIEEMKRVDPVS